MSVATDEASLSPGLEEAAAAYGVLTSYRAAGDRGVRRASHEALRAVLGALGAPEGDPAAVARARRLERLGRLVEPVAVSWEGAGGAATVPLTLLASEAGAPVVCALEREDGSTREWRVTPSPAAGEGRDVTRVEGRTYVRVAVELPADLPRGYHRLTVSASSRTATATVVRAPARCWAPEPAPRGWGSFLPLYALRTARGGATADFTDLRSLAEWTGSLGGEVVGTLPLFAGFLRSGGGEPFDASPYAPVTRLFWNEMYVDPERAPGWERSPEARRLLEEDAPRARALREGDAVDYREAARLKRRVLEALARTEWPADGPPGAGVRAFLEARPEVGAYAAFRAAGEGFDAPWPEWPAAARAGDLLPGDYPEAAWRYHLWAQWAAARQVEKLADSGGAGLYLDLPVGSHAHGYDTWSRPDLFAAGASVGAPPDDLFEGGQDWGFPPLLPDRLRATGHAYWRESLARIMSASSLLRLDHVMGLHRLFWVPPGLPATEGVYVRYPAEELYAVLAVESHRHRCEVAGEDLGTVPPEVREAMERRGLRRLYVVPFELDGASFRPLSPDHVASLGTHDTPPWAGVWRSADDGWRDAVVRALRDEGRDPHDDAAAVRDAALHHLATSPARLVLASLEDLWLETEPQNRPGTAGRENWRRKARLSLEEMRADPRITGALERLDRWRRTGGPADGGGDGEPGSPSHAGDGETAETEEDRPNARKRGSEEWQ